MLYQASEIPVRCQGLKHMKKTKKKQKSNTPVHPAAVWQADVSAVIPQDFTAGSFLRL